MSAPLSEAPLPPPSVRDKRRAIGAAVAASGFFAVMDTLVKALTADYPVMQVVFMRAAVSLVIVVAALPWFGGLAALRVTRLPSHLLRVGYALIATVLFFYAFRYLPLTDVYVIGHAAPFFVTALSFPLLGERVGWRRWAAVGVGFVGVLIVLQPWVGSGSGSGDGAGGGFGARDGAALVAALGAALFYALTVIHIRALSGSATAVGMVTLFLVSATAMGAALGLPVWVAPTPPDLALMALMGVAGVGGQVFMTLAYRLGPAALAAPFEYTGLIWATAFGAVFFGDFPTLAVIAGGCVIIASGLYILHRETR